MKWLIFIIGNQLVKTEKPVYPRLFIGPEKGLAG